MDNWKKSSLLAMTLAVAFTAMGQSLCGHAQLQQFLQITSPPDGAIVHPGQTITVAVTSAPNTNFHMVGILAEYPLSADPAIATAAPFKFLLSIPRTISRARRYNISASAVVRPGEGADSDPIHLDVEPASPIVKLQVDPDQINFDHVGEQIPLNVRGTFADGLSLDITESSLIRYKSNDARIATVDKNGVVTAAGAGTTGATEVVVQFGDRTASILVSTTRLTRLSQQLTRRPVKPSIAVRSSRGGPDVPRRRQISPRAAQPNVNQS